MAVLDDLIKREKVSGLVQMVIWDEYFSEKIFFFFFEMNGLVIWMI